MVSSTTVTNTRGDATRAALISAGLEVFSRDGFDAASTRAIADTAGVQQALIGFHFGGKEGLYLAVFQSIAEQMNQRLKPIADAIDAQLTSSATKANALELLLGFVDAIVAVLVRDESSPWARLIAREQQQPSRAFEILHEQFFGPMNALLTRLVMSVRGDTEREARLTVVSIMGQMLVLRLSRAVVLRQLGWSRRAPRYNAKRAPAGRPFARGLPCNLPFPCSVLPSESVSSRCCAVVERRRSLWACSSYCSAL